ncbi:Nucleoside 2-deoxyribosyltransferase like protein [uncultured archaeon]|nr:Nucleoside 2-deoxyribosyltransferase like protein [uncultured archaeon]
MAKLIIPKTYIKDLDAPLIFLAGPIRSAPNWQDEAIKILFSLEPNLIIASPRRGIRDEISEYIVKGDENHFPRQRAWERHYLELASKKGAILFWLPGEEKHDCQKVYGAMTRIELGQWMTNYRHDNSVKFCVGSDGNFQELDTIKFDLSLDAPDKKIFKSLEETCAEALRLARI